MQSYAPNSVHPIALAHSKPAAALVIGGGIGGMRSALDLADAGLRVYLVEQTPCLGGRVAQLGFMFPQHDCVLCRGTPDHGYGCTRPSISPAYIQNNTHPNLELLTNTHILDIEGQAGDFSVSLRIEPRYVDPQRCINCGYCNQACPVELPDSYQQGMTFHKAAFKTTARAVPDAYVIDRGPYCEDCGKCAEICPTKAIHLDEQPRLLTVEVGAIILALGFQVFDPAELGELGFGRYPNVVSAMQYERLASRSGPTEGVVVRPSDNQRPKSIAWLQCIGSRDQKNSYCSSICCMYATKEAILAKQRLGKDVTCQVFIMDERAFNKEYGTYFSKARNQHGIQYTRCRISAIDEDPGSHNLLLHSIDADGRPVTQQFDMVVLATGLQPPQTANELARILGIQLNKYGFCQTDKFTPLQTTRPGVFVCGAFSSPKEIVETIIDASGAAAEVMRLLNDRLNSYPYTHEYPFLEVGSLPPERDLDEEPVKVGAFICTCAGTLNGDSGKMDLKALAAATARCPGVAHVEVMETACLPENLAQMKERIQELGLNRVAIAACSNRTHDSLFQRTVRQAGLNPYLLELVNLREQCSRVHHWQPEIANRKAQELVRMAVGRLVAAEPVYKKKHHCRSSALVVGGGVAGMTAALAIADSGYDVHLVEQTEVLGGNLLKLDYLAEGYNPQLLLRDLVNRVRSHQRIQVHTRTEIKQHSGHIGFFQTTLTTKRLDGLVEDIALEHGVAILATGGLEAHNHAWLDLPGVITQHEMEEMFIHQPKAIAALHDVVMIQCVRPEGILDYCSRVCCTNAIKNAIRLKLFNPQCNVSILYRNIVTYGFREEHYNEARRLGVIFVRYTDAEPPELVCEPQKRFVRLRDLNLNRVLEIPADLIPLSMSILPAKGTADLARMFHVPLSSEGFFQEAQLKLRPMDFMREGIFLAGIAHYPKFLEETISHALAAAARALTVLSSRDMLFLGGVVAQVDPTKCVGCLTCTRVCPFQIPKVIQQEGRTGVGGLGGAAYIDPAQCQGCGTCTGECPATAIQLINYSDQQMMLHDIQGLGQWLPSEPQRLEVQI